MKFLVTGANGFIGSKVVKELCAAGNDVRALVRKAEQAEKCRALGAEVFVGDLNDMKSLLAAMQGVNRLFHIAGHHELGSLHYRMGSEDKGKIVMANVEGTRNVVDAARKSGIERMVYTSTLISQDAVIGRDGEPREFANEVERSKWLAHHQVVLPAIAEGLPAVIVEPGMVYGPGGHDFLMRLFERYLQRRWFLIPREVHLNWSYVDDVVHGHVLAMENGEIGMSYPLAGPRHSMQEVFKIASAITGIPSSGVPVSGDTTRLVSGLLELVGSVMPMADIYTADGVDGLTGMNHHADLSIARKIGAHFRPLEEGLRTTFEFIRNPKNIAIHS